MQTSTASAPAERGNLQDVLVYAAFSSEHVRDPRGHHDPESDADGTLSTRLVTLPAGAGGTRQSSSRPRGDSPRSLEAGSLSGEGTLLKLCQR